VFLSKALEKYDLESRILASILKTVAVMLGVAVLLVAAGAIWEGTIAGALVRWLSGS